MKRRNRISYLESIFMFFAAAAIDLVAVIPFVQLFASFVGFIIFTMWFWMNSVHPGSRTTKGLVLTGIGMIPIIGNILPDQTLYVVLTIRSVWREDKAYNKARATNEEVERQFVV